MCKANASIFSTRYARSLLEIRSSSDDPTNEVRQEVKIMENPVEWVDIVQNIVMGIMALVMYFIRHRKD